MAQPLPVDHSKTRSLTLSFGHLMLFEFWYHTDSTLQGVCFHFVSYCSCCWLNQRWARQDWIACTCPEVTHDPSFLSYISPRSVDLLAKLLGCLHDSSSDCLGSSKRRKVQRSRQWKLWTTSSDVPTWSSPSLSDQSPGPH